MTNPARLIEAMRAGSIISVAPSRLSVPHVPTTALAGLAEERAEGVLEEMVWVAAVGVTGVENTIFISQKAIRERRGSGCLTRRYPSTPAKPHLLRLGLLGRGGRALPWLLD